MLALIKKSDNSVVKQVLSGSTFVIGNDVTSPAYAGWDNGTYTLKEISPADPIPVGYVGVSQNVVVTNGVPKYVWTTSVKVPTADEVNAERDKRIATGFQFAGKSYAMDNESKARIIGAATLAGFAIAAGAQTGNYRWHGGSSDFVWIADDNSLTRMDAQTCFAFGQAAAAWETKLIFAARVIKQSSPVPGDYTNDTLWPVSGS
jgi:hypothetical protein